MGEKIDRAKYAAIGAISRRSGDRVQEGRDAQGNRFKAVTDQLGNTVTQRAGDRQDVQIRAPHVRMTATTTEER